MKYFFSLFILILLLGCKSYYPFLNKSDKNNAVEVLNKNINLSQEEFDIIKIDDSLLYSLKSSIAKKNVPDSLIRRRLDSFFLGNYTRKEIFGILKIDRGMNGKYTTVEFMRDRKGELPKFDTTEEIEAYIKKMESIFNSQIKNSKSNLRANVKKDSI